MQRIPMFSSRFFLRLSLAVLVFCGVVHGALSDTVSVLAENVILPEPARSAVAGDSTTVISGVELQVGDVIPPWSREYQRASNQVELLAYRMMNWLHIKTRPYIVANELLFSPGDRVDSLIFEETERNLRAYQFIHRAEVSLIPAAPGSSVVRVRTSDNFSLAPSAILERGGGKQDIGAVLKEYNLLGFGKQFAFYYDHITYENSPNSNDDILEGQYTDPRLFGSHWRMHTYIRHARAGENYSLDLQRPFFSLATKWAGGVSGSFFDGTYPIWGRGGVILDEFPHRSRSAAGWVSHVVRGSRYRKYIVTGRLSYFENEYTDPPPQYNITMQEQALIEPTLTVRREVIYRYHRKRNLDDFGAIEDIRQGWSIDFRTGLGFPWKSGRRNYFLTGLSGQVSTATRNTVTVLQGEARVDIPTGENGGSWSNLKTFAFLHHYYHGLPAQTLALNINWRGGWGMDAPYYLYLGGFTGLRGYDADEFAGSRRLLISCEDRIFTPVKIVTIALGMVAFVDAGYVWPHGEDVNLRDLHAAVGFGLRFFNTKASAGRVSRIDVAYRLHGQRGFEITLGSEHNFSLFNARPTPSR